MKFSPSSPLPLLVWLFASIPLHAAEWQLTVAAGDFNRQHTLVTFSAPAGMRGQFLLREAGGASIPLQVEPDGTASFIEAQLNRGTSKSYIVTEARQLPNAVSAEKSGAVVKVSTQPDGAPIFHYQTEPGPVPAGISEGFRHGAHLHPVFSPAGRIVTANHPPDHPHQRGIFMAWTKTEFEGRHPDFWNMGKDKGGFTGEVRFANLERVWSGPVRGGFVSRHRFIDHTGGAEKDVLAETWEVAAAHLPNAFLIDFTSTQMTAGDVPLKLPKYHYGGFGVRGAAAWDPVDQVTMLTSNGGDRKTGDNTKAKWVHLGGLLEGNSAGIAVLIHPENFRFPQGLRLNPKNPQLCVAPSQDGDWEILPGKPFVSRYRVIVADRPADAATIEAQWNDYATPPTVEVRRK
jgi:hypothetical protein